MTDSMRLDTWNAASERQEEDSRKAHTMRKFKFALVAAAAFTLAAVMPAAPAAQAQVSIGIGFGAAPVCPYGYFDYAPYNCAPYGYYGPQWFNGGLFIGAGPWFHGPRGFHGYVNHAYDPHYGYHGGFPARGGHYREPADHFHNFHASHMSDGHGHEQAFHGHR
jgi:hypothetical protein